VLAGELAEVVLAGEAPELLHAAVAVGRRGAERLRLVELGELRIALVERLQVERVLVARVVEVVLLVELRDEPVDAVAVGVEVPGGRRCAGHSRLG
jgi:hypothetical protein